MAELSNFVKLLKAARTDAENFHRCAQNIEICLTKMGESDGVLTETILNDPNLSELTEDLMQELWFAKESSELRLAANLHAYL
jgi:hypothetical protein